MKILVTGHAGFLGAHLCRRLLEENHEVVGRDVVSESPTLRVLGVKVPVRDDWPDVDGVIHLAGQSHISLGQERPAQTWETNVRLTWECLEAYRGTPTRVVLAASNHCRVRDVYGTSKEMVALLADCYRHSWGMPVTALIHVNAYGPADPHASHLVTGAILDCLQGQRPRIRSDGTPRKGYLFVEDVVEAYRLCLVHDLPGRTVAAAPSVSALDMARLVMAVAWMGGKPEVLATDLSQSGYEEVWQTSPELRALGWSPREPATAMLDTLSWYSAHGGMAWLSR